MTEATTGTLILDTDAPQPCGVGDFTRGLAAVIGPHHNLALGPHSGSLRDIAHAVRAARRVIVNLPLVRWKKLFLRPVFALLLARVTGRRAIVCLHEWASLHIARRISFLPLLLLASRIVVFSPRIGDELRASLIGPLLRKRVLLAPLPPNLRVPEHTRDSALSDTMAKARAGGRIVIGCFGSIYPGKEPMALLDTAAAMKRRGLRPLVVYAGSFIRGTDRIEEDFNARVHAMGLDNDVLVSGFVADGGELFGILGNADVFAYLMREGLTARRASVLASVQSGRPVIATAPARDDEFAHHARYRGLIESGAITLIPRDAAPETVADVITNTVNNPRAFAPLDTDAWWRDTAAAVARAF